MTTTLTDRSVQGLRPKDRRYEVRDTLVPGLYVDVTKAGAKNFILCTRYPGKRHPGRRTLGKVGVMTLAQARSTAREWLELIARGIDPEHGRRSQDFSVVIEEFITRAVRDKRKGHDVEADIRRELIPAWGNKAIGDIKPDDVLRLIERIVDRGAIYQAHNVFSHIRRFFNWCRGRNLIDRSPCDWLKPAAVIGRAKDPRQRVLTDDELRRVWSVVDQMTYPYGPLFKLLTLTGARKSEVSDAKWGEFDFKASVWTIPPERFKSDTTHIVPLTPWVVSILQGLYRFTGDCVFSTDGGRKPVNGFSKAKRRIDQAAAIVEPWVIHDLRRSVRSRLSELRVPEAVAELLIGHGRKGLARVYDQHKYLQERREALLLWEQRLREIVT
jgi:integrase